MVDMNVEDDFGEGCRGNMHEYYMTTTMKTRMLVIRRWPRNAM